jgi:hypothetical protein
LNQCPDWTCFTFLLSIFEKRHFCLLKIAILGVSLWHFHAYMYYNTNWFISFFFLLSTLEWEKILFSLKASFS